MRIAIIGGSGKMGRWFARFLLQEGQQVVLTSRNESKLQEAKEQLGVEVTTSLAAAVKNADAVLISVPIDSFEDVVKELQPHLQPGQIVLDITSIKVSPVATMHQYLKSGLVLGTHPVFGPGARDIKNQNIVLTPTNQSETDLAQKIKQYLAARGARVTLMTPQEHDEMMAVILGLSHFIALVAADTLLSFDNLKQMEAIGGSTFRVLLTLAEGVITEDADFYASLQTHLPKMTEIEALFQSRAKKWADMVQNKDVTGFARRMSTLRETMEKTDPDFGKAYENMYKLLERG